MTKFFTDSEKAIFAEMGWSVWGDTASAGMSETLGIDINVMACGELWVQQRGEDGKWRWVVQGQQADSAMLAACDAADWFHALTGWDLLDWYGGDVGPVVRRALQSLAQRSV
jgi:hypothetical protein